jgi:hypothetical protein
MGYTPSQISPSLFKTAAELLDLPFGFAPAAHTLSVAIELGDRSEAARAISKLGASFINLFNYPLTAVKNIALGAQFIPESLVLALPTLRPELAAFLTGTTITTVLANLGTAAAAFGLIYNSIELSNQREVDVHLQKETIQEILNGLNTIDFDKFFDTLPDYIKAEITEKAEKQGDTPAGFFRGLGNDVEETGNTRAKEMIEKIRKASPRQQVFHMISIVACVFAIIAFIAAQIACPFLILAVLSIAATGLGVAALLIKKGWVENPGDGFSLRACLPASLRGRKEDIEIELKKLNIATLEQETPPEEPKGILNKIRAWFS